jgi:hypothetical protein
MPTFAKTQTLTAHASMFSVGCTASDKPDTRSGLPSGVRPPRQQSRIARRRCGVAYKGGTASDTDGGSVTVPIVSL